MKSHSWQQTQDNLILTGPDDWCCPPGCLAVPFEEDLKNPLIWYLDHNYLESMFYMFKKINGTHAAANGPGMRRVEA